MAKSRCPGKYLPNKTERSQGWICEAYCPTKTKSRQGVKTVVSLEYVRKGCWPWHSACPEQEGLRQASGAWEGIARLLRELWRDLIPHDPRLVPYRGWSAEQKVKKFQVAGFPWELSRGISPHIPSLHGRECKKAKGGKEISNCSGDTV